VIRMAPPVVRRRLVKKLLRLRAKLHRLVVKANILHVKAAKTVGTMIRKAKIVRKALAKVITKRHYLLVIVHKLKHKLAICPPRVRPRVIRKIRKLKIAIRKTIKKQRILKIKLKKVQRKIRTVRLPMKVRAKVVVNTLRGMTRKITILKRKFKVLKAKKIHIKKAILVVPPRQKRRLISKLKILNMKLRTIKRVIKVVSHKRGKTMFRYRKHPIIGRKVHRYQSKLLAVVMTEVRSLRIKRAHLKRKLFQIRKFIKNGFHC
jgi:hypothetical protein